MGGGGGVETTVLGYEIRVCVFVKGVLVFSVRCVCTFVKVVFSVRCVCVQCVVVFDYCCGLLHSIGALPVQGRGV